MTRGTTPTLKFWLDESLDLTRLTQLYVTFKGAKAEVDIPMENCTIDYQENTVEVTMTQEQTLEFEDNEFVDMQIRMQMNDGMVFATNIEKRQMKEILKDGVI